MPQADAPRPKAASHLEFRVPHTPSLRVGSLTCSPFSVRPPVVARESLTPNPRPQINSTRATTNCHPTSKLANDRTPIRRTRINFRSPLSSIRSQALATRHIVVAHLPRFVNSPPSVHVPSRNHRRSSRSAHNFSARSRPTIASQRPKRHRVPLGCRALRIHVRRQLARPPSRHRILARPCKRAHSPKVAIRRRASSNPGQALRQPPATCSADHPLLRPVAISPRILQSFRPARLHGHSSPRKLVDRHLLRRSHARLQYRRRRTLVARLRATAPRTSLRPPCLDRSRNSLVRLPPLHAAHPLGHNPHGHHRPGPILHSPTHKKHLARHNRPHHRQPTLLPNPGKRRNLPLRSPPHPLPAVVGARHSRARATIHRLPRSSVNVGASLKRAQAEGRFLPL